MAGNVPRKSGAPSCSRASPWPAPGCTSRFSVGPVRGWATTVTGRFARSPGFEKGSRAVALAHPGASSGGRDDANLSLAGCRSLHAAPPVRPLTDEVGEVLCCEGLRPSHYPSWRTFSLKMSAVESARVTRAGPSFQAGPELTLGHLQGLNRDMLADSEGIGAASVDLASGALPRRRLISWRFFSFSSAKLTAAGLEFGPLPSHDRA